MSATETYQFVLLTTSVSSGGAAIACMRQAGALREAGHKVVVLSPESWAETSPGSRLDFWFRNLLKHFIYRWNQTFKLSAGAMFSANPWPPRRKGWMEHRALKEADAVILHWVNHGFMGAAELDFLKGLGKPVLWHMHDMWAFTGGCHYSGNCRRFLHGCGSCPLLLHQGPNDESRQHWEARYRWFAALGKGLALVAPSPWLASLAAEAVKKFDVRVACIPNPFDPFRDGHGLTPRLESARPVAGNRLLFAAVNTSDPRKGWDLLVKALNLVDSRHSPLVLKVAGKMQSPQLRQLQDTGHAVENLGLLGGKAMQAAYLEADIFVIPSLEENLPNTILESFAAGTPVAGFAAGGIANMVQEGVNGALAEAGNPVALADAIVRLLKAPHPERLRQEARKSLDAYRPHLVEQAYRELTKSML